MNRNSTLASYRGWLYFMANHLASNAAEVDDLAQEGYIAMWRALDTFDPAKGALPAWLTKAARMRMNDIARGHGQAFGTETNRNSRRPTTTSLDALAPGVVGELEQRVAVWLDDGVALAYHRGQIARALADLTEEQRLYIVLRFWHQMSASEIQEHISSNVHHLWHGRNGARARLQESLQRLAA